MTSFRVFHALQRAHGALFRAADHALKAHTGLTATQQAVLFALVKRDRQPISAIAARLNMGKSSLTGLIDRMVAAELVTRQPCPTDGRSTIISIGDAGRRAAEATAEGTQRINAALLAPFTAGEQKIIARFLTHAAENGADIINSHAAAAFQQFQERTKA